MPDPTASRTARRSSSGNDRVAACYLLGVLLTLLAAYVLLAPLERPTAAGPPFDCGTAVSAPTEEFPRSVCGDLNQRRLMQGGFLLAGAAVVAGGGVLLFGQRRSRPRDAGRDEQLVSPPSADQRQER